MNKPPVLLPMEVKKRELESKLLLALHLANAGFEILIGDRMGIKEEEKFIKQSIFLSKSLSIEHKEQFERIQKKGGKVLILFEEGAIILRPKYVESELKSFYPQSMFPYIDYIFAYGKKFEQQLINYYPELKTKTFVSGNPRFDLHKPRYFEQHREIIEARQQKLGEYILIDTNFLANHHLGKELLTKSLNENKDINQELKDMFVDILAKQPQIINTYLATIKQIAATFKNYTVVVRPHPVENENLYKEHFKEITNIVVTKEGSATSWLFGAKMLLHKDCTTAIEGYFTGKYILSFTPHKQEELLLWLPVFISDEVHTTEQVIDKIKYILNHNPKFTLSDKKREEFKQQLINVEEESCKLITDKITELAYNMPITTNLNSISLLNKIIRIAVRQKLRLKHFIIRNFMGKDYHTKFPKLTLNEVTAITDRLKKIEQIDHIEITQHGINTFLIKKMNTSL